MMTAKERLIEKIGEEKAEQWIDLVKSIMDANRLKDKSKILEKTAK